MKKASFLPIALCMSLSASLYSCKSNSVEEQNIIDEEVFDPNSALNTVFDGKIFSIPSPVQTAYLIKNLKLEFDESLLNNSDNVGDYITEYQQAINLGIYGTDLGYSAMYDQKNVTLNQLSSVEKLTTELGLDAAFDTEFMKEFEENANNENSSILLMSDAFRQADNFLKHSNRKATSALILTGGWIESIYFACQLNNKKPSKEIQVRIGEQKQTLNSIIDILIEYNNEGFNDELISKLKELKKSFDKIKMNYTYAAPDTDAATKTTTFHHELDIEIGEKILNEINNKISEIRADIIKG